MCGWRKTVETCAKVTSDTKCNQSIDSDLERCTAYMVAVTEVSGASLRGHSRVPGTFRFGITGSGASRV